MITSKSELDVLDISEVGITNDLICWLVPKNINTDRNIWKDMSGKRNNFTLLGTCINNEGLVCDGETTSCDSNLTLRNTFTLSVEVTVGTNMNSNFIISQSGIEGHGFGLCGGLPYKNNKYGFYHGDMVDVVSIETGNISDIVNQRILLTVVKDNTNVKIYLNGQLINTVNDSISLDVSRGLSLCKFGEDYLFKGTIHSIKIFNRVLDDKEVNIEYDFIFNKNLKLSKNGILYLNEIKHL